MAEKAGDEQKYKPKNVSMKFISSFIVYICNWFWSHCLKVYIFEKIIVKCHPCRKSKIHKLCVDGIKLSLFLFLWTIYKMNKFQN